MTLKSRLPIPVGVPSTHNLRKMRSEGHMKGTPERKVRHLRSMGQLSPPPNEPLPPLPPRSPSHPSNQVCGIDGTITSNDGAADTHRLSASNSSSCSNSKHSKELGTDSGRSSPRNTMLIHQNLDQEKIEFRLRSDSKQTPTVHDLGRLLELCSRLKEMGTSFTKKGEMQTYGNPPLNVDFEQMLHLGAEYDELWNAFFTGRTQKIEHYLWPVLRVLKKMLQNESIMFDDHHTRLNHSSTLPKLIRLSDQYDVLREEWFEKTLSNIHPAERWPQSPAHMELPKTPITLGWDFAMDKCGERKNSRRASRLAISVEKQPSMLNGPGPTIQDADTAYPSPPDTPASAVSTHGLAPIPAYSANATCQRELTTGTPVLLHGSSPLQRANTASMLLPDDGSDTHTISTASDANHVLHRTEARRHEHNGVLVMLVEDERRRAEGQWHAEEERQCADVPVAKEEKKNISSKKSKKSKKNKGVKKWLRTILGLKRDDEQR